MTQLDAIEKYGKHGYMQCEFCFFGIVVAGKCTRCDGQNAVDEALKRQPAKGERG